jgi:lipopolysaccharide transport system permease protein/teichoic acid transport system permease protein
MTIRFVASLVQLTSRLVAQRAMIAAMVARNLRFRYAGTALGTAWSIANPVAQVAVFWFVFAVGFKVHVASGTPYVLFFLAGLLPWMMFSESVNSSLGSIVANPHLVKKMAFPTEILPIVQVFVALVPQVVLVGVVLGLLAAYGRPVTWHLLQLPYYVAGAALLALGLGWLLAALNVFVRDIAPMLGTVLNIWFWLTPIAWPPTLLPPHLAFLLGFNPMVYIVEGYRGAFLGASVGMWPGPWQAVYFWVVCLVILAVGAGVFRRLKVEFAEVL